MWLYNWHRGKLYKYVHYWVYCKITMIKECTKRVQYCYSNLQLQLKLNSQYQTLSLILLINVHALINNTLFLFWIIEIKKIRSSNKIHSIYNLQFSW